MCFSKGCVMALNFFFFIHFLSVSHATPQRLDWSQSEKEKYFEWIRQLTYRNMELRRNTGLELVIVWPWLSSLFLTENHRTQTSYHKVVWISVCQFIHFPLLHCFLSSGRSTVRSLRVYSESLGIACVAGVKTEREEGNLGARERAREKWKEPSSLLPRAGSRALNPLPLPLPFRTFPRKLH